jgi:hypothetical protein
MKLEFVAMEAREIIQKARFSWVVTSPGVPHPGGSARNARNRTIAKSGRNSLSACGARASRGGREQGRGLR